MNTLVDDVEGLTRKYNDHIIISEHTYEKVKDIVQAVELVSVTVKGKEKPVVVLWLSGVEINHKRRKDHFL